MEKLDKLSRLKSAVKSGNKELIDHALEEISSRGDDSYIAPLIEFVHQHLSSEIKEKVFRLFDNLKDDNAVDRLISEMKNEKNLVILERLVASCWQNGLNYSSHLPYFVHLVVEQEFQIAFEAFTVIENMYGKIDSDVETALLDRIGKSLQNTDERKHYLLKGMLEIIPHIPIDQDSVDY